MSSIKFVSFGILIGFLFGSILYYLGIWGGGDAKFLIGFSGASYYIIDFIRLLWIEDNLIITFATHINHVVILLISSVIFPVVGVRTFNTIYKKLGISGY